jgi:hypothetical protein
VVGERCVGDFFGESDWRSLVGDGGESKILRPYEYLKRENRENIKQSINKQNTSDYLSLSNQIS